MNRWTILITVLICIFAVNSMAAPLKKMSLTPEEVRQIELFHENLNLSAENFAVTPWVTPVRPFSEVEESGYVFMSSSFEFNSLSVKKTVARYLPAGVTLVIFASPGASKSRILNNFRGVIDLSRVRVVELSQASRGFWARDGLPVPVWSNEGVDFVDARYYHNFEPDAVMARWFGSYLHRVNYYYEGGNFMANDRGDCLMVNNSRASRIPNSVMQSKYGCKQVLRFSHVKGIGHIDENAVFLRSNVVATDTTQYVNQLTQAGFQVLRLPRPRNEYETYANALLVNGTAYVPVFNQSTDSQALSVYRSAGLNVVPVETSTLANDGQGSIHCITMTYPKIPFAALLEQLGAREL